MLTQDRVPTEEGEDWLKHVVLNRKISAPQLRAVALLAVQTGGERWIKTSVLKQCGVMLRTLQALKKDGIADSAEAEGYFRLSRFGQAWAEHNGVG